MLGKWSAGCSAMKDPVEVEELSLRLVSILVLCQCHVKGVQVPLLDTQIRWVAHVTALYPKCGGARAGI